MTNTCGGCPATWTGTRIAHCSGCHETFSTVSNFDTHRVRGVCEDPVEVGLRRNERGVWFHATDKPRFWEEPTRTEGSQGVPK